MDRIDRLGWADGRSFVSYGLRIGVRASAPGVVAQHVEPLLPPHRPSEVTRVDRIYSVVVGDRTDDTERGKGPRRRRIRRMNLVYADATRIARERSLGAALQAVERDAKMYVAEMGRRRVFVHAGAVAWDGRAILLPGRSHAGKSSLVAALVRAGATYYSDEYAVLDDKGRVHPYATPLALRLDGGPTQTRVAVAELGGREGRRPLPVGLVVVTEYREGARFRPRPLTPGRGLLALLQNAVAARRKPEAVLPTLRAALTGAALKGVRGEASGAARAILERLSDAPVVRRPGRGRARRSTRTAAG